MKRLARQAEGTAIPLDLVLGHIIDDELLWRVVSSDMSATRECTCDPSTLAHG